MRTVWSNAKRWGWLHHPSRFDNSTFILIRRLLTPKHDWAPSNTHLYRWGFFATIRVNYKRKLFVSALQDWVVCHIIFTHKEHQGEKLDVVPRCRNGVKRLWKFPGRPCAAIGLPFHLTNYQCKWGVGTGVTLGWVRCDFRDVVVTMVLDRATSEGIQVILLFHLEILGALPFSTLTSST